MKSKILLTILITSFFLFSIAQRTESIFAITGDKGDYNWMNIRKIDVSKGIANSVFDKTQTTFSLMDADTKKQTTNNSEFAKGTSSPTATMVAAAAFDKAHGKLFFTPMYMNELRWLDIYSKQNDLKFYTVTSSLLNKNDVKNEANHITRMVIGADGNGYALTNDGNHLYKFTTGKKTIISDLGNLVDAASNNQISVHNRCTSWGGDMVASADGSLYLITMPKHVFKIDINTRVTTYIGMIKNLPADFNVNGAAVEENGLILLSNATNSGNFYRLDLTSLETSIAFKSDDKSTCASDLASAYLAFDNAKPKFTETKIESENTKSIVSIYPNPVTEGSFQINFSKNEGGEYTVQINDLNGRNITNRVINLASKAGQVSTIDLDKNVTKGMYIVKVYNRNKTIVYTNKIIVQ